jgi:hypothetical protein
MNKKEMAISFLRLASSGNVREAYEKYVHPDFRHHNPYFPGDRASLLAGMEDSAVKFPKKEFEAVRALFTHKKGCTFINQHRRRM